MKEKDNSNKEYIWSGNPAFWGKHSPVLFPIVGTLKNNSYQHDNVQYQLSRHGFAREMEFELIDKQENSATFSLVASPETKEKYPFDFDLHLIYTLKNKSLTEDDFKKYILEHYTFLSRPVFIIDGKIYIGNSQQNMLQVMKALSNV